MSKITKKLLSLVIVLAMVLSMTPVISLPAAASTFASPVSAIVAAQSGTVKCEACKQEIAWDAWTPISMETIGCASEGAAASGYSLGNGHYYLAEDLYGLKGDGTNPSALLSVGSAGTTTCLHLNGKTVANIAEGAVARLKDVLGQVSNADLEDLENDIDATASNGGIAIWNSKASTLNVMGDGYVTSRCNSSAYGSITASGTGELNIYGGNYSSYRGSRASVLIRKNGGTVNIYGGTFEDPLGYQVGSGGAGNYVIEGGTFLGWTAFRDSSATSDVAADSSITVRGGVFETDELVNSTLSGVTPVISDGTFTVDPSDYLDQTLCIAAAQTAGVYEIVERHTYVEGKCSKCQEDEPEAPAWGEFDPASFGGKAYCEACYKKALAEGKPESEALADSLKEWQPYSGAYHDEKDALKAADSEHEHLYLTGHQDFSTKEFFLASAGAVCINLNGFNVTSTATADNAETGAQLADSAFHNQGTLNIMDAKGTSVVSAASYTAVARGNLIYSTNGGVCNVYGGTFTHTNTGARAVTVGANGTINVYDGVTITVENVTEGTRNNCISLIGTENKTATLNVYGGDIVGSTITSNTDRYGASIYLEAYAQCNIYDGTVSGGKNKSDSDNDGSHGGNIYVASGCELNVYGGEIYGGEAGYAGGNIYAVGNVNISDHPGYTGAPKIYDGVARLQGGNISIVGGTVEMSGGQIYGGSLTDVAVAASRGGNVYVVDNGTLKLSGTGEIYGGLEEGEVAANYGGNICVATDGDFQMSGGTVRDGYAKNGANIMLRFNSTMSMSDGTISGGADKFSIYLMDSSTSQPTLTMSGTAQINAPQGNTAVRMYGGILHMDGGTINGMSKLGGAISGMNGNAYDPVITFGGNATIKNEELYQNLVYVDGAHILIKDGWSGEIYAWLPSADPGVAMSTDVITRGTYDAETGITAADTSFTGKMYIRDAKYQVFVNDTATGAVALAGAKIVTATSETWYANPTDALAAYDISTNGYIQMYGAEAVNTLELTKDAYVAVDSVTVNITGNGKLYAIDLDQDVFEGTGKFVVADDVDVVRDFVAPINGYRYLAVTTAKGEGNETVTSNRLNLALNTVTLRAGTTNEGNGLYYKAKMSMSKALADKVSTYGVVMSLTEMPYADFVAKGILTFTAFETEKNPIGVSANNGYTAVMNSGSVFGIMKTEHEKIPAAYATVADYNAARGDMPVYANAYLEIDLDGDGNFEYIMSDTDPATTNDVAWSMHKVLSAIDNRWSEFTAAYEKINNFYSFWSNYGMDAWTFDNIKKV